MAGSPSAEDVTDFEKLDVVGRQLQLKDIAYERLRDAIVRLAIPPGTQLKEATLSKQLGISKTPIREAFVRLEGEGLVEVQPYRGATVRGYSEADLIEIFELRGLLEGFSTARAAEVTDEAWRQQLRDNITRSRAALAEGDTAALANLLEDFDRLLQSRTANPRVVELLDQIQSHVERIGRLTVSIPGRLEESVEQHARIAEAVLAGHARTAELLMRSHINSVLRDQITSIV
jgi:GntR family transcriptional regulator, rspAB operon transcriptional repressor